MNAEDAIRFLDHQAKRCHDRDAHESLCLLLPALRTALALPPMDYGEALAFEIDLRESLRTRAAVMTGRDFPN